MAVRYVWPIAYKEPGEYLRDWRQGANSVSSEGTYCIRVSYFYHHNIAVPEYQDESDNHEWVVPDQCAQTKTKAYRSIRSVTAVDTTPDSLGPNHTIMVSWTFADDGDLPPPDVRVTVGTYPNECTGRFQGSRVTCDLPVGPTYSVLVDVSDHLRYNGYNKVSEGTTITVSATPQPTPTPAP